jgi:predicted NAD/FAD-dependent oxidoreductase
LAFSGDYCLGAGVENAVKSGLAAADAVMMMLTKAKV